MNRAREVNRRDAQSGLKIQCQYHVHIQHFAPCLSIRVRLIAIWMAGRFEVDAYKSAATDCSLYNVSTIKILRLHAFASANDKKTERKCRFTKCQMGKYVRTTKTRDRELIVCTLATHTHTYTPQAVPGSQPWWSFCIFFSLVFVVCSFAAAVLLSLAFLLCTISFSHSLRKQRLIFRHLFTQWFYVRLLIFLPLSLFSCSPHLSFAQEK